MAIGFTGRGIALRDSFSFGIIALVFLWASSPSAAEENRKPEPCTEDAMIVFDASGSMSGNQTLGIPNSRPRIDEVRAALARVLPTATKHRRVGLITYGPGPYNQCNVKLDLKPTADAFKQIMRAVNGLVPAGKTPLTSAVEQAAEVLNYRSKPGVIVVVTDGEETCGGAPCELAKQLRLACRSADNSRHRLPLRTLLLDGRQQRGRPHVPRQRESRDLRACQFRRGSGRGAREDARLPDDLASGHGLDHKVSGSGKVYSAVLAPEATPSTKMTPSSITTSSPPSIS